MRHTVCVDLDGVLASWERGWQGIDVIGDPIPGAIEFTKQLAEFADVVVFTCRCNESLDGRHGKKAHLLKRTVTDWLDAHGFTYHDVYVGQGKPIASAYIDDRAVTCQPEKRGQGEFEASLGNAKRLCGGE